MPVHFTHHRRVAFSETDMAGIVHFAQYFNYMESAEHAMFRSVGLSVHGEFEGQRIGWPRVAATCEFKVPLRFEDMVAIEVSIEQIKARSLVVAYDFRRSSDQELVAQGRMTIVCAALEEGSGRLRAIGIPAGIVSRFENLMGSKR